MVVRVDESCSIVWKVSRCKLDYLSAACVQRFAYLFRRSRQVTRGLKLREGEPPAALNGFLYSIMRTSKQQRRAIAISCLRNFDEHAVSSLWIATESCAGG